MRWTLTLTAVAMVAFAANSLLARGALGDGGVDAFSFTAVRLLSGAAALAAMVPLRRGTALGRRRPGDWLSAVALFVYALGFSLAYVRLGAATGALVLFASVQLTMILSATVRSEFPRTVELAGLAIAFAALVYLLLPGLGTPDPVGSAMMVVAGAAWGVYSLRGRGAENPIETTAGNFLRAAILSIALLPFASKPTDHGGLLFAVISGVIASGLGYAVWYRVLPRLRRMQAAIVQLTVPPIAAAGAVVFLGEHLTTRLIVAGVCILGGVTVAIVAKPRPAAPVSTTAHRIRM